MARWMDRAAGGMSQRLHPGGAIIRSRSRNPAAMSAPLPFMTPRLEPRSILLPMQIAWLLPRDQCGIQATTGRIIRRAAGALRRTPNAERRPRDAGPAFDCAT